MKKLSVIFILFCSITLLNAQTEDKTLARVKKVNGVEAYVMCEPLRDYDVIVDVNTGVKAESVLTGGIVNKSISGRISQFINRAAKENANIDAVVYASGKRIVGIKFKDEGTVETKGIGRVSKMKGMPVFVMCEPLIEYTVLKSKGGGIKWKSAMTGGIVNNSIEEDVEKIVNKLDGVRNVQAFLFDGTKEGEAIMFNK